MVPVSLTDSAAGAAAVLGEADSAPTVAVGEGGPHRRADAPDACGPVILGSLSEHSVEDPG